MAWLDNADGHAAQKKLTWGQGLQEKLLKTGLFDQPPLLKLRQYWQALFFHKKVNDLQRKIHTLPLDDMHSMLGVMCGLWQIKKRYEHNPFVKICVKEKIKQLKKTAIAKSYQAIDVKHRKLSTSHAKVLTLIKQAKPSPSFSFPSELYWHSTADASPGINASRPLSFWHPTINREAYLNVEESLDTVHQITPTT